MDLRALRTFICVANTGSLSRASSQLHLAQPALSRHIKLMEEEIGIQLFERSPRGMRLTVDGEGFLDHISGPVRQIDQSVTDFCSKASRLTGQVILGVMSSASGTLLGSVFRRAVAELPGVSLRIIEGSSTRLAEWLRRGEIDISLLYGPTTSSRFRTTALFSEDLFLVGPTESGLRLDTPVPLAQLAKRELVLTSATRGIRAIVDAAAAKAKLDLRVRFEVDSTLVLKDIVAHGLGHTILPYSALSAMERKHTFSMAPLVRPRMTRHIVLALPSDRPITRATSATALLITDESGVMMKSAGGPKQGARRRT